MSDAPSGSRDQHAAAERAAANGRLDSAAENDPERGAGVDRGAAGGAHDAQTVPYGGDLRAAELAEEDDLLEIRVGDLARCQRIRQRALGWDEAIAGVRPWGELAGDLGEVARRGLPRTLLATTRPLVFVRC